MTPSTGTFSPGRTAICRQLQIVDLTSVGAVIIDKAGSLGLQLQQRLDGADVTSRAQLRTWPRRARTVITAAASVDRNGAAVPGSRRNAGGDGADRAVAVGHAGAIAIRVNMLSCA